MNKRQKRDSKLVVNMEAAIYEALQVVAKQYDITNSDYGRKVIIEDLKQRGLLPSGILEQLVV